MFALKCLGLCLLSFDDDGEIMSTTMGTSAILILVIAYNMSTMSKFLRCKTALY